MSNIDKQALREKFERWWEVNYHNGNPPRFGWEHWRDGDGYQIDDDESELDCMWESWQAAHSGKLEAAERRIAELEAREVKFPELKMLRDYLAEVTHREREDILVGVRLEFFRALEEVGVKVAAAGKGEAS
ncbi:hypothetical protein [Enterobacter kobei]|uniref:hypothetical protein n=1 Tax=Enterobacter kobei TaxID=208224 RepID=UPI0038599E00